MNPSPMMTAALLCAALPIAAQEQQTSAWRYTIEAKSEMTTERQMLVDGEEMGRGGAGAAPVTASSRVVFDERTAEGGTIRTYATAEGSWSREGRDGEPFEAKVAGALAGKQLFFDAEGAAFENGADGKKLDERAARGLPSSTDLAVFVPESLEEGATFTVDRALRSAIRSLAHPVRSEPAADDDPEDAEPDERPQRGERGRRGSRGMRGRPMAVDHPALSVLASDALAWTGEGRIVAVDSEEHPGAARVEFDATVEGSGTPAELGLASGRMARFRRGGGEDQPEGKGTAELKIHGVVLVDLQTRRVRELTLKGDVETTSETAFTRREAEVEVFTETSGKFSVAVRCAAAPADEPKK